VQPPARDCVDPLDRLIGRLYRSALRRAPGGYRDWALRQLRELVAFDGALWGTGTISSWRFHTCTVLDLPADFPQALEDTRSVNPLVPHILATPDTPVDRREVMDDECFYASEVYQRCFARYGIRQILSTGHVDPRSGVYSLLTLYRRGADDHFSAVDQARQARLAFHLLNAASHAFFLHLNRAHAGRPAESAAAVVDRAGLFHEVQPRFVELLDEHFPERQPLGLPFTLPEPGRTLDVGGLCVKTEPLDELLCVYLWPAGPLDRLTAREREVVYAVAHGLSFKQVARNIGVAPSTVANHLYRVYHKLGLSSRSELAQLVYPEV